MADGMDRRTVPRLVAAGALAPALLGARARAPRLVARQIPRFAIDLPVPAVLSESLRWDADRYVMTQRRAMQQILPPKFPAAPIWGYEGQFPGPTVVATRGRPVEIRQVNQLGVEVSTHLHGSASRPADDGQPFLPIRPGASRTYHYPDEQPAASLWYHDHADMRTSSNVYRGLAGMYLLHDPSEDRLGLPDGEHDLPLVLQDRVFDTDGRLVFDDAGHTELYGDVALVNGAAWPRLRVEARRYRFRILNGSNSRPYLLALTRGLPMTVVAGDQGLLARPARTSSLLVFPAERHDVVVDFSSVPVGSSVWLQNQLESGPMLDALPVRRGAHPGARRQPGPGAAFDHPAAGPGDRPGRPGLAVRPRPLGVRDQWQAVRHGPRRRPPAPRQRRGLGVPHAGLRLLPPVHPHLVRFQVLSRDGRPPEPYERGWKDTVFVGEQQVVRVAARFGPYRGRYVLHCHNLVHEDHQMMTQFEVV